MVQMDKISDHKEMDRLYHIRDEILAKFWDEQERKDLKDLFIIMDS